MTALLHAQFDYFNFLYGLAFLLLASICLTLYRKPDPVVAWGWLGWFGVTHGLYEWLETLSLGYPGYASFQAVCLILLSLSYLCLLECGRVNLTRQGRPVVGLWLTVGLAALSLLGGVGGWPGLFAMSRLALGLPGGLWAGLALWRAGAREKTGVFALRAVGLTLMAYGVASGLVVPPAPFFPASILNTDVFRAVTGFPIEVGRGLVALLLIVFLGLFRQLTLAQETDRHTRRVRTLLMFGGTAVLFLLIIVGWLITQKWGDDTKHRLRQEYDYHARMLRQVLLDKMTEADNLVQALAGAGEILTALTNVTTQNLEAANIVLDRYSQVLPLSVCYLMDLNGLTIASSNRHQPDSFVGKSYAFRPYFQLAEAGSPARYLALGVTSRERGYYASHPVWGPQGNVLGVAVIKRPLTGLEKFFHVDCLFFLIDPHGIVFLSNHKDLVLKSLWPVSPDVAQRVAASRQFGPGPFPAILNYKPANGNEVQLHGKRYLVFFHHFPFQGWCLVHLGPSEAVAVSRLLGILTTLILCVALLALLLGWDISIEATHRLRKSEQAHLEDLRRREEQYRRLFADAGDGIVIADLDGRLLDANKKMEALLGYSWDELVNLHYTQIHPPDSLDNVTHIFQQTVQQGSGFLSTGWVTAKDGRHIPVEIVGSLITYGGRTVVQGIYRDISERRKSEEERLRLSKLESLGVLAGGIAHDFNNILTAILGNLSLAAIAAPLPPAAQERLKDAEKACVRAQGLAQQLLTFAKGGRPIKKIAALGNLLREAASFTLSGSRSTCRLALADDLWPAEVDEGQVTQVINNLLLNADQAMPAGGVITLQADNVTLAPEAGIPLAPGNYVRISITDQGIGIPEKYLDRIFDPYFTTKKEGSGLGLATAYAVITNHGGHITVDSQPGVGTCFTIYLPAAAGQPDAATAPSLEPLPGQGRILIMDDDDMVRHVLAKMLTKLNYEVMSAADGTEALRLLQEAHAAGRPFQAVILDLTIPGGMGGKEAIAQVRQIDPTVKAVVSSGYSDDPVMADYQAFGFDGVIVKPYKIQELSRLLDSLLNQP